jgi:hypothetical protein
MSIKVPILRASRNTIFTPSIPHAIVVYTIAIIETSHISATKDVLCCGGADWSCIRVRRRGRWIPPGSYVRTNEVIIGSTDAWVNYEEQWKREEIICMIAETAGEEGLDMNIPPGYKGSAHP